MKISRQCNHGLRTYSRIVSHKIEAVNCRHVARTYVSFFVPRYVSFCATINRKCLISCLSY